MLGRGVILALVLVAASTAAAAPPDYEAAKRHYQAAEKAAAEGKFKLAAREYGIAYDITKDPVLFFKIGHSYDRADDCTTAKVYYLRYLKEGKPAPEYRRRTEALIQACKNRGRRSSSDPAPADTPGSGTPASDTPSDVPVSGASRIAPSPTAPPTPPVPPASATPPPSAAPEPGTPSAPPPSPAPTAPAPRATTTAPRPAPDAPAAAPGQPDGASLTGAPPDVVEEPPSWQRTAAWTSVGMTFALGTTAAVLALSAGSREEDIQNLIEFRDAEGRPATYTGATSDRYRDLVDEGDRLDKLSVVALAATGVAAAASAVFFVLDGMRAGDEDARATGLAPSVSSEGAGLSWTGSF
jgi:hypothetical protein